MIVSLDQISLASKCLRRYSYSTDYSIQETEEARIALAVLQRAYLKASRTGFKADWRRLVGWVDKLVFKDIEMSDTQSFQEGRKRSEHILRWLTRWYHKIHLPEQSEAWTNLALSHDFSRFTVEGTAPIVKLTEDVPTVMVASSKLVNGVTPLYNDIRLRGLMWMLGESLDADSIRLEYISIGEQGGFEVTEIFTDQEANRRTAKMAEYVGSLIMCEVDYPSVSDQCNSCEFRRRCRI